MNDAVSRAAAKRYFLYRGDTTSHMVVVDFERRVWNYLTGSDGTVYAFPCTDPKGDTFMDDDFVEVTLSVSPEGLTYRQVPKQPAFPQYAAA